MKLNEVIVKPLITEKSTIAQESGKYVFHIDPRANKVEVKQAVEHAFSVTVLDVNITKNRGKMKRFGPRMKKTPDIKKAVVTLKQGDRIQIIEGV
ncbi:MAG: 50S ribosomal protein L23 [Dehalococcoidia bacterium]|nr:50S ribosomal protein L23 [Dehalococcoidia bacterium]